MLLKTYQMRGQRAKGEEGRVSSRWWGERTKGSWTSRPRRKEEAEAGKMVSRVDSVPGIQTQDAGHGGGKIRFMSKVCS